MEKEEFGKLFQYLCDNKSVNDSTIAKALKVDRATVGRWKKGERTPNLSLLPNIAEYFNISMDVFTYDTADKYIKSTTNHKKSNTIFFTNVEEAMQFIIKSPTVSAYGGYDLDKMSDQEIIEFANELAELFKVLAKRHQK